MNSLFLLFNCLLLSCVSSNVDIKNKQTELTTTDPILTTSNGRPIDTITASMTVGQHGPILLQDFTLLDSLAKFDRERIPERVVHAKGAGASGYFEVTTEEGMKYCKAKVFEMIGKRTPIAMRMSTVGGERGSADTARDPRGFAIKFYTEEGIWDMVGNNTPIFFIRDPILFPSFIHTQKRNPVTNLKDPNMFWDFISLRPETTNQVTFLFSPKGTPDGFRHMDGFGSHTYKVVNEVGESHWVKFHFLTDQGIKNLSPEMAMELSASDPDYATRDLFDAIKNEDFPSWTLYFQIMTPEEAKTVDFDPFDVTKRWSEVDYPLFEVGRITLNKNPSNYFAEVEQIAFSPAHMVPGIEPSPDRMLQGRLFSYTDTHRHRLGPNVELLPINAPINTVANNQRDGTMRYGDNQGGAPNYFPNSFGGAQGDSKYAWQVEILDEDTEIARFDLGEQDNFTQAGEFYRELSEEDKEETASNIASSLIGAEEFIQKRAIANFMAADEEYGEKISMFISMMKEE
mmetsp:Transcript_20568/g.30451  ORF Transcript_20568/g.30451 Transcript_20568/m.30451 type:complete len:514 (-) Transcript_20568:111-1652(-)